MTRDCVVNFIEDMSNNELFTIWNDYCEQIGYDDDIVYYCDDIIEMLDKEEIINICQNCVNVNFWDTYFKYGCYYYQYETSDNVYNLIDDSELIDYIMDNPNFGEKYGLEIEEDDTEDED